MLNGEPQCGCILRNRTLCTFPFQKNHRKAMQLALLCATFAIMVMGCQAGSESESCSMVNGRWHCVKNSDPGGNAAYSSSHSQSGGRRGSRSHISADTGYAHGGFGPLNPMDYVFGPGGSPFGPGGFPFGPGAGAFSGARAGAFSGARAGAWGRKKK